MYIWQRTDWPNLYWDVDAILIPLAQTRSRQGFLRGKAEFFQLSEQGEILEDETLNTAAVEGERLSREEVRSSIANRLGLPTAGLPPVNRKSDGLVEVLLDAVRTSPENLTESMLYNWHAALFPTGYSGISKISVAGWRTGEEPMRVVSGNMEREIIHFEAPPSHRLGEEMTGFINWWNREALVQEGILFAAEAQLRFVTIHPFDDGNGRLARVLTDRALARDEKSSIRYYSLSACIMEKRKEYYDILERTQKGAGDITEWILWFLELFGDAVDRSLQRIEKSLFKDAFFKALTGIRLNDRQLKVINRLIESWPEEFAGGMTNKKYTALTKISPETAKRDLKDLESKEILIRNPGGGRSVSYRLNRRLGEG